MAAVPVRLAPLLASALAVAVACGAGGAEPRTEAAAPVRYYLALGDSLAVGTQPGRLFSGAGYADQLLRLRQRRQPRLRLIRLACPGETTTAFRRGGRCPYPRGSQLAQAAAFLRANRGRVALVTIDIGANDLLRCGGGGEACTRRAVASLRSNLPPILRELRRAAGPRVPIVGMDYYAPLLARWLEGGDGERAARRHLDGAVIPGNAALRAVFRARGVRVARVEAAFATRRFTPLEALPDGRSVPRNVAAICRLTWMCSQGNIHANADGHRTIARAFDAQLPR